jgi:hypothetical protein
VPSVQPRHEAPSRLRPPQRSRVAGAKKYKYNTKYNTNTYNTNYKPPSGVLSFPGSTGAHPPACAWGSARWSSPRYGAPAGLRHACLPRRSRADLPWCEQPPQADPLHIWCLVAGLSLWLTMCSRTLHRGPGACPSTTQLWQTRRAPLHSQAATGLSPSTDARPPVVCTGLSSRSVRATDFTTSAQ